MSDIQKIVDQLSNLTVLQAADLAKLLEEQWGVSASAQVAAAPAQAAPAAEAKTEFDVMVTSVGNEKLKVIKAVKDIAKLGLKESKELVESLPGAVLKSLPKEEAEKVKKSLEEAGATVELK